VSINNNGQDYNESHPTDILYPTQINGVKNDQLAAKGLMLTILQFKLFLWSQLTTELQNQ
jgi:hypothetical protein